MNSKSTSERGQSLVLIALLLIGMIAFLGLIIDGGEVYVARRNAQDSADSAVFAGVRKLALRPDNTFTTSVSISKTIYSFANENYAANAVVASYIDENGNDICAIPCSGVPASPLATGIRVTVTLHYQPSFINLVIGNGTVPVPAIAAAQSGRPGVATQLMPMSLPFPCNYNPNNPNACPLNFGQAYTLTGDSQLPGGFQWVDWTGGASATDIANYLALDPSMPHPAISADPQDTCVPYGTPSPPCIPPPSPWIPSGPGVQPNNNISCVLDAWLDLTKWGSCGNGNGGNSINWNPTTPQTTTWTVPVFDTKYSTGNNALYHTVMFAEFEPIGYWFANNQCNWVGAPSNHNCNNGIPASPNTGWQLQSCNLSGQKCILGKFLRQVTTNLLTVPGSCNVNGVDICAIGLSQ